jgi:hypothetical protein
MASLSWNDRMPLVVFQGYGRRCGALLDPDQASSGRRPHGAGRWSGALKGFGLHSVDATGLVHALLLPIETLVLNGH